MPELWPEVAPDTPERLRAWIAETEKERARWEADWLYSQDTFRPDYGAKQRLEDCNAMISAWRFRLAKCLKS